MLWDLVNAEAFTTGDLKDFSQVGLEVLDDYTLRVRLRTRVPYFLDLTAFYTKTAETYFRTVREAIKAVATNIKNAATANKAK